MSAERYDFSPFMCTKTLIKYSDLDVQGKNVPDLY